MIYLTPVQTFLEGSFYHLLGEGIVEETFRLLPNLKCFDEPLQTVTQQDVGHDQRLINNIRLDI